MWGYAAAIAFGFFVRHYGPGVRDAAKARVLAWLARRGK